MISKFALILLIFNNTLYTYPIYIKLACMIRMITLILPLCCLFNPERHELARGIYIIREVYIAMFVIRIIQLTIAFNHSYHTCKFDIDWISILLKISKSMQILISSPPAPPHPASFSCSSPPAPKEIWL